MCDALRSDLYRIIWMILSNRNEDQPEQVAMTTCIFAVRLDTAPKKQRGTTLFIVQPPKIEK